jgi:LmbE family N-acetylglucosaminyl deacetylase
VNGRVLVVTAHPDDPEFAAGGTIAKLATEGREVTYVIATNGSKGSGDRAISPERLVRVRQEEQQNAARVLGVARVEFLGYEDGEIEDTRPLRRDVTREIRRWRPELIITSHPSRGYSNEPHKVREVYLVQWEQPQLIVDVAETMELKLQAARCHASQVADFTDFEARLRNRAAVLGAAHGYRYAEGFDRVVLPG